MCARSFGKWCQPRLQTIRGALARHALARGGSAGTAVAVPVSRSVDSPRAKKQQIPLNEPAKIKEKEKTR